MDKTLSSVNLFGIIIPNSDKKHRFDESNLFSEQMHYAIFLKKIKMYFGNNNKGNKTLLGFEASYINNINGQKVNGKYQGIERKADNIEAKEFVMKENEYINNFELGFDNFYNYIAYIKLISSKGNELEFGKRPENPITLVNYKGDNMIQFFWGDYHDDEGIIALAFKYTPRKQFIFGSRFPILWLRYRLNHDEEFKKKIGENYQKLDDISNIYLYRACLLPEAIFSKILKYC